MHEHQPTFTYYIASHVHVYTLYILVLIRITSIDKPLLEDTRE